MSDTPHSLTARAAGWKSPHVRGKTGIIAALIDFGKLHGIHVRVHGRQAHFQFEGKQYLGKYEHPNPNGPSRVAIYEVNGANRRMVARFETFADVVRFFKRPRFT